MNMSQDYSRDQKYVIEALASMSANDATIAIGAAMVRNQRDTINTIKSIINLAVAISGVTPRDDRAKLVEWLRESADRIEQPLLDPAKI